jgi:hypothetical protein
MLKLLEDTVSLHRYLDLDILFLPWRKAEKPCKKIGEYKILYGDPEKNWELFAFDPQSRTFNLAESSNPMSSFETVVRHIRSMISGKKSEAPVLSPMLLEAVERYGDEFVVAGGSGFGIPIKSGWLEATVLDPMLIGDYLDWMLEDVFGELEAQSELGMKLINGGGDFAYNSGPVYSPVFFERVMAPRWKRIFDFCREKELWYIMRSDGNLWPVADSLFGCAKPHAYYECDYDAGMFFCDLRARYPELVLMGNISIDMLYRGTRDDVASAVKNCIEAAFPRVVIASANAILHGTPPENVFALFDTAKEYVI